MLWQAVSASSWGKDMETLLTTYSAIGKPLLSCCAPIWTPVLSETNVNKIQVAKINSLRTALGCVRKSDIDHLHAEAKCQSRKTATCCQPNSCSPSPSPHTQTNPKSKTIHGNARCRCIKSSGFGWVGGRGGSQWNKSGSVRY